MVATGLAEVSGEVARPSYLTGRPSREGKDQDFGRDGGARLDQVPGSPDQELGLAGARPRHDQLGTEYVDDDSVPVVRSDPQSPPARFWSVSLSWWSACGRARSRPVVRPVVVSSVLLPGGRRHAAAERACQAQWGHSSASPS